MTDPEDIKIAVVTGGGHGIGRALARRLSEEGVKVVIADLDAAAAKKVAAELGCGHADIRPLAGDTAKAPESGSTTASRGTYVVWRVAKEAAPRRHFGSRYRHICAAEPK